MESSSKADTPCRGWSDHQPCRWEWGSLPYTGELHQMCRGPNPQSNESYIVSNYVMPSFVMPDFVMPIHPSYLLRSSHDRSTLLYILGPLALPHVVGIEVCLYLLWLNQAEAWKTVSTNSRLIQIWCPTDGLCHRSHLRHLATPYYWLLNTQNGGYNIYVQSPAFSSAVCATLGCQPTCSLQYSVTCMCDHNDVMSDLWSSIQRLYTRGCDLSTTATSSACLYVNLLRTPSSGLDSLYMYSSKVTRYVEITTKWWVFSALWRYHEQITTIVLWLEWCAIYWRWA